MNLVGVQEILLAIVTGLTYAAIVFSGAFALSVMLERKP